MSPYNDNDRSDKSDKKRRRDRCDRDDKKTDKKRRDKYDDDKRKNRKDDERSPRRKDSRDERKKRKRYYSSSSRSSSSSSDEYRRRHRKKRRISKSHDDRRNNKRGDDRRNDRSNVNLQSETRDRGRNSYGDDQNLTAVNGCQSEKKKKKDFYCENSTVANHSSSEIERYRQSKQLTIKGDNIPNPIFKFDELELDSGIREVISRNNWVEPTAIQAQGLPVALSGRNMVGIARTGSGKTASFLIPAIVHSMAQPHNTMTRGGGVDGPICLMMVPTRKLAIKVHSVAHEFYKSTGIRAVCCYGGANEDDPRISPRISADLNAEIVIGLPDRLELLISCGELSLQRTTYLVLDEADVMLTLGFERQIRKIISQIRPDRQTLMWSATWPREIQKLASDFLGNYIQINVGFQDLNADPNITLKEIIDEYSEDWGLLEIIRAPYVKYHIM